MVGIAIIFLLVLVGITAASFYFYNKSKKMERQKQLPSGYGGGDSGGGFSPAGELGGGSGSAHQVMQLKLNDIISYFGTDYMVEGKLTYWEEGYTWITYRLVDGDDIKWLSAEEDDGLEISIWEDILDLQVSEPVPEKLDYQGETYRMFERGQARVNQQGRTGNKTGMQVKYWEFKAPSGSMLSVEKWGGAIEVSEGKVIKPIELDIFPGDEVAY